MNKNISIKKVFYFNLLLATTAAVIVSLFQLLGDERSRFPFFALMGFLIVFAISFLNVIWLKFIRNFPKKRYVFYALSYVGSGAVYLILWPPFSKLIGSEWEYDDYHLMFVLLLSSAVLNTTILVFQYFIILQQEKTRIEVQLSKLKSANVEAANLLLKQQIQPHFLFNSLSNLKALYSENPEAGETYLVHLANYLRSSISNQNQKVSTLKDEWTFLNDYVEMQKIRFGNALDYTINFETKNSEKYLLPSFSLQLLVENAIKHNEITLDTPLIIRIDQKGNKLTVKNNIKSKKNPEYSTGQGLANLSERYNLLSGEMIEIKENGKEFSVTLILLENEDIDY